MRRREFIAVVGGAAAAWPLALRAQQPGRVYRVAYIASTSPVSALAGPDPANPLVRAFLHALRDLRYIEGQNLVFERRSAEGRPERTADIVRELLRLKVDVIVTGVNFITRSAMEVTTDVPIVMTGNFDPVRFGFVTSLARPGGNVTGLTLDTQTSMLAKRLEILKEAVPGAASVAVLIGSESANVTWEDADATARTLGMTPTRVEFAPTAPGDAFRAIARQMPDALAVAEGGPLFFHRRLIVEFAANHRLAGIFPAREYVEAGGLMSYGTNFRDLFRRAAVYVDKILKGAKPGDLPIEQPTKFELVVNLKTAKALGITIPESLLARADEVIE